MAVINRIAQSFDTLLGQSRGGTVVSGELDSRDAPHPCQPRTYARCQADRNTLLGTRYRWVGRVVEPDGTVHEAEGRVRIHVGGLMRAKDFVRKTLIRLGWLEECPECLGASEIHFFDGYGGTQTEACEACESGLRMRTTPPENR